MKFRSQDHLLFNMSTVVNTKVGTHWKLLKQMVTKPSQTRGGEGGGSLIFHWITEELDNSVPNADEDL